MSKMNEELLEEANVCMAIQKKGAATAEEIQEKLKEWKLKVPLTKIKRYCKNLQKRDLISLNYVEKDGLSEPAYNLAKAIFKRDIPIVHYKDIVDMDVKKYPEIKELIDTLEKKQGTSKGRKPDHCKYYVCRVEMEVKDKVLGFMPFKNAETMEHYRDNGKIVFLPSHFRAYLRANMRLIDKSETMKNYIGFDYGETVLPKGKKPEFIQFSILDWNQGKGIRKYEVLPKGSIIKTRFRIPSTDFKPEEFKKFLETIGEMPLRGFGGRSSVFGRLKIVKFEVV